MTSDLLRILMLEPYFGGSHQAWLKGYQKASRHQIELLTLPAQNWKWRMLGGAVTLARMYDALDWQPDLIIASDMLDLSLFRAMTRDSTHHIPHAIYFHENQLTYPLNQRQGHGWQYAFINYASALSADKVYFNSDYHQGVFLKHLPRMLKQYSDFHELQTIDALAEKSSVLSLGVGLARFNAFKPSIDDDHSLPPLIVWNHRWEKDKNPKPFLDALVHLANQEVPFRVALLGENFRQTPSDFVKARDSLGDRVVQFGYIERFEDYARLLWQADYVVSTARQDFFGISIVEAIYCGCIPLLANRLNYPALIPGEFHSACLFNGDDLLPLLLQHLRGSFSLSTESLTAHVVQYDWTTMRDVYDETFTNLIAAHSSRSMIDT